MSYLSIYVLIIWICNLIIVNYILKKYSKLLLFTLSWLFGWLFISTFSFTGIRIPDEQTYNYFLLVFSSISLGSILCRFMKKNTTVKLYDNKETIDYKVESILDFLYKLNYFVVIPSLLYFLVKSIILILQVESLSIFRAIVMGKIDSENFVFSNLFLLLYYMWFLTPIVMISSFIAFSAYILRNDSKLLIISFICLLISSLITMGRGEIYIFLLLFIFAILYKNDFKIIKFIKSKFIIYIFSIFILIILISFGRMSQDTGLEYILNTFLIDYHTCGFAIFNDELLNKASFLNTNTTYGMASTGTISYIIGLFYHLFDSNFYPIPEQIGRILNEYKDVGVNDFNQPLLYNAFGTIMYSVYLDGGLFLSVVSVCFFGYSLTKFSLISRMEIKSFKSFYTLSLVFILIYMLFTSLFIPILSGNVILYFIYIFILFRTNITRLYLFNFSNKFLKLNKSRLNNVN